REAVTDKIPYILVIGDDELGGGKLTVRVRDEGGEEVEVEKGEFIERVTEEINFRK
ncbi:MAG: His/Gly/Thr/Pro-type tRNA ligase C-terminal domain-containing protein, partial [Candidatus Magasanikbacteria bacterium]